VPDSECRTPTLMVSPAAVPPMCAGAFEQAASAALAAIATADWMNMRLVFMGSLRSEREQRFQRDGIGLHAAAPAVPSVFGNQQQVLAGRIAGRQGEAVVLH